MKQNLQRFAAIVFEAYMFLAVINAIAWLLNQPNTIAFYGAVTMVLLTCFVGYYRIQAIIQYFSKEKKK